MIKAFADKYSFSAANDLVSMVLFGKGEEFSIMNSLRFFMQEYNLEPEFEFLIHYDDSIFDRISHFCICKKVLNNLEAKKLMFLHTNSKYCLHLTAEETQKYQNSDNLRPLYEKIYEFMNEFVMPFYIRNCVRWIVSNQRKNFSSSSVELNLIIKGNSSPLDVKFVNRKKTKLEEKNFSETIEKTKIDVKANVGLLATISTETVCQLIKWFARSN